MAKSPAERQRDARRRKAELDARVISDLRGIVGKLDGRADPLSISIRLVASNLLKLLDKGAK